MSILGSRSTPSPRCSGCVPGAKGRIEACRDDAGRRSSLRLDRPLRRAVRHGPLARVRRRLDPRRATTAFIVTDSLTTFAGIAAELPDRHRHGPPVRHYLTTFLPKHGRRLMRYELLDYQRDAAIGSSSACDAAPRLARGEGPVVVRPVGDHRLGQDGHRDRGHRGDDLRLEPTSASIRIRASRSCGSPTTRRSIARPARGCTTPPTADAVHAARTSTSRSWTPTHARPGRTSSTPRSCRRPAGFAQSGTNIRQFSFWDILRNTIQGDRSRLYLVLDEAHRGMKRAARPPDDRAADHPGRDRLQPADADRLGDLGDDRAVQPAMGEVTRPDGLPERRRRHERVRASGIVKDQIGLDRPDEKGTSPTTLLREAVKATRLRGALGRLLDCRGEPEVLPVLVVQVADKPTDAKLAEIVAIIESEWPDLGPQRRRQRLRRAPDLTLGLADGRVGQPGDDPDRDGRPRRARQGGDLDRLGLPARRGALLRAAGQATRRTSPRSSAGWSASRWLTGSPPTMPSTRSRATCRCSTEGPDGHQGRARGTRRGERPEHAWRDRRPGAGDLRAKRDARPGRVRVRRVAPQHPDPGQDREPVATRQDAGSSARGYGARSADARRRRCRR